MTNLRKSAAVGVLIVFYVFGLTHSGLGAWFSGDDLTNIQFLHGAGQRPFSHLLAHCLVVVTPDYRPLGGVVYRILYGAFGLHPVPFRITCYALLLLNLLLASQFFYRLSHSRFTAALGTLVFSVHTCMGALYFNTGTLYDILCFTFGFAALILYVTVRDGGALLRGREWIAFFVLFGLALDSKEMAITWPLLLFLYECIFRRGDARWPARLRPIALTALLALLYGFVKTQVPNEMSITPQYIPRISAAYSWEQLIHYYRLLVWNQNVSTTSLATGLAVFLVLGIAIRNQQMIFGFLFANIALLPLLVIPGRYGFVWYIPFAGWALYMGTFLAWLTGRVAQWIPLAGFRNRLRELCFLALLVLLFLGQRNSAQHMGDSLLSEENYLRSLHDAILLQKIDLTGGSRILIADDPLGAVDWSQLFLIRLIYNDATIWVDRPTQMGRALDLGDLSVYSAVVHASATPIRILLGQSISQELLLPLTATPASVNRNNQVSFTITGFRGCALDAEYRLPDDELARSGLWKNWCTVGGDGTCTARINQDAERGIVQIRRVRLCGGDWHRTNTSFEILP